jgi:inhibitor of KinA
MLFEKPKYRTMGDRSLLVELGDGIHKGVHERVRRLFVAVKQKLTLPCWMPCPAIARSFWFSTRWSPHRTALQKTMDDLFHNLDEFELPEPATVQIPVVYGDEYGPDLDWVAATTKQLLKTSSRGTQAPSTVSI